MALLFGQSTRNTVSYIFFRENAPRILIWRTSSTTETDRALWMGQTSANVVAYVEPYWMELLSNASLYRYEMPTETFESVDDVGMWVSRSTVHPTREQHLFCLPDELAASKVEIRCVENLSTLKPVWDSTLHASSIRLRNARNWI